MAKQITVFGDTYTSIAAAYRALEPTVPLITVRWRLKNNWEPEQAFIMPMIPPRIRRMGHEGLLNPKNP